MKTLTATAASLRPEGPMRREPIKVPSPAQPLAILCYAREPGHGGMGRVCDRVKGHDGEQNDEAYRQHTWVLVDYWKDRDGKD